MTLPPRGDGDADGRSVVFLDEVDAGADVLDLQGRYVVLAPLDCRRRHDGAWVEGEKELGNLGRGLEPGVVRLFERFHRTRPGQR